MIDPTQITHLAHETLAFLAQHSPWAEQLAEKAGAAAIPLAVKETWELVKSRLSATPEGAEALTQLASTPTPQAAEPLKQPLLAALQADPAFARQLSRLVLTGSGNLVAQGDNNKQAKVDNSQDIHISIS